MRKCVDFHFKVGSARISKSLYNADKIKIDSHAFTEERNREHHATSETWKLWLLMPVILNQCSEFWNQKTANVLIS